MSGVRRLGEGAPLVMLAGVGGRGAAFLPLARRWRARYESFLPDPTPPYAPWDAAEATLRLLDVAGVGETFHLLGASLGGCVALAMAARYPARVRTLTLCATFATLDGETRAGLLCLREARLVLPEETFLPLWRAALYGDAPCTEIGRAAVPAEAFVRQLDAALAFDGRALAPRIRCPACVTCGEDDRMIPPRLSIALAELIPGARLETHPGGHMHWLALASPFTEP